MASHRDTSRGRTLDHLSRRGLMKLGGAGLATLVTSRAESSDQNMVLPVGACDCHVHVVGRADRYKMSPDRGYTPPEASADDLGVFMKMHGLGRCVIVQPSIYGLDNQCMLDALDRLNGRARGVAVVDPSIADAELDMLHAKGVRGVRINLESAGDRDPAVAVARVQAISRRIARLGWHVQIYAAMPVIASIADRLGSLETPVSIDHFGMAQAAEGAGQSGLAALRDLVRSGGAYVKLSASYRISRDAPAYADVDPIARALIEAGPERMLWGSDWPHTNRVPGKKATDIHPYRQADDGMALQALARWTSDAGLQKIILVDNPARLYAFEPMNK